MDALEDINQVLPSVLTKLGFMTEGALRNAQSITLEEFVSHDISLSPADYLRYQDIFSDSSWSVLDREMEDRRRAGEDMIAVVVESISLLRSSSRVEGTGVESKEGKSS